MIFTHCPVCLGNFATIDITTEQNMPDKMGAYQLLRKSKHTITIIFIMNVLINNKRRSRCNFFCVIG